MKRTLAALTIAGVVLGGSTAALATVGTPEVNPAAATISLKPAAAFASTTCPGEDGIPYVTYRGNWVGTENDALPGSTDYNLTGPVKITGIVWTVNRRSLAGILHGRVVLTGQTAAGGPGAVTYAGPITLVTKGLPTASTGNGVVARGWISAATLTNAAADGGSIYANVEFRITPGFGASGEFGMSGSTPDLSVASNNLTC